MRDCEMPKVRNENVRSQSNNSSARITLTPPGYPNAMIPTVNGLAQLPQSTHDTLASYPIVPKTEPMDTSLSPSHSPPENDTPPKSPKSVDDSRSVEGDNNNDDDDITKPKVNSHGKIKIFKCKQCDFETDTKLSYWLHHKTHIRPEKLLRCHLCPFGTEFKHHLEYHILKHRGDKPIKCQECSYTCVNQSMLTSHLKSHSNVYPYRCFNCSYATKYCHSLKLHLRKFNHKPGPVLNADGTPSSSPLIDVYGTRRGPKNRNGQKQGSKNLAVPQETPPPMDLIQQSNLIRQRQEEQQQQQLQQQIEQQQQMEQQHHQMQLHYQQQLQNLFPSQVANPFEMINLPYLNHINNLIAAERARAVLSQLSPPQNESGSDDGNDAEEEFHRRSQQNVDVEEDDEGLPEQNNNDHRNKTSGMNDSITSINTEKISECKHCRIVFKDEVLYTIHMGYHGFDEVFKCNLCGEQCEDSVSLFIHIARVPHP